MIVESEVDKKWGNIWVNTVYSHAASLAAVVGERHFNNVNFTEHVLFTLTFANINLAKGALLCAQAIQESKSV